LFPQIVPEEGSLAIPYFPEGLIDYKVPILLGIFPYQGAWGIFVP
jgi:hypothetical protein